LKISILVAARPNFVKAAPLAKELKRRGIPPELVHAGQHYDPALSQVFLDELELEEPALNLGIGSGTHGYQVAATIEGVERYISRSNPDVFVVVGDVNATAGGALAASKMDVFLVHLEAGLRSFDRSMPEEINRIVADHLSDLCLAPSEDARKNLFGEGIPEERVALVGNLMIDTLLAKLDAAKERSVRKKFGFEKLSYAVATLHRPSNVDSAAKLASMLSAVADSVSGMPVVFPVHPRTQKMIDASGISLRPNIVTTEPLGYIDFLSLLCECRIAFTDSGGIQEETSVLGVPCLTLRPNTERPVTVEMGTNTVVGTEPESIVSAAEKILRSPMPQPARIPLWDGKAAARAADEILDRFR